MENGLRWVTGALKSLTMWFNGLFVAVIGASDQVVQLIPQMKPYLTTQNFERAMLGVLIANVLLRIKTTKSLKDK